MKSVMVFPGQGSQAVGMGKALFEAFEPARAVFAEVDEALGEELSKLVFEGPLDELTRTANAQPALMATSIAALRSLESVTGRSLAEIADGVAGHSLGEYSALVAAGALDLADAARLLRLRGAAMQEAVAPGIGAMAAILGLEVDAVEGIAAAAARGECCEVANDNGEGQAVVSGHGGAVTRAVELGKERGARRSVMLQVSAPFHCALMAPAAARMARALAEVPWASPQRPLIANVTAELVRDAASLPKLLEAQITGRVRWRESMATMARLGTERVIEVGAGRVLCGLARRGVPGAAVAALHTPAEVEAFAQQLEGEG